MPRAESCYRDRTLGVINFEPWMTRWMGVVAGLAGLVSAIGCGSLRQPEPLSGLVQPPAKDAGQPRPESPPDASSFTSRDVRTDPIGTGADAGRGDAAVTSAGHDAGASGGGTPDGGAVDAATVVSPLAGTVVAENGRTAPQRLAQDAAPVGFSCGHDSRLGRSDAVLGIHLPIHDGIPTKTF